MSAENTALSPLTGAAVPAVKTWREAMAAWLNLTNSLATRTTYERATVEAMTFLDVTHPGELTAPALTAWRAELVARIDANGERRLAPSSVSLKLAALRAFLKFCRVTGLTSLSKEVIEFTLASPTAKVVKPYEVAGPDDVSRILAALADKPRDRALVALALGSGLRASELTGLRLSDIHRDEDGATWLLVRMGKGRKSRMVPLSDGIASMLSAYIASARLRRGDMLFQSRQGETGRLTGARLWQIVTGACRRAGIEKPLSPHSLRHSYAIGRLRAGASPEVVRRLLGHSSLATTQRYIDHLDLAELKNWVAN